MMEEGKELVKETAESESPTSADVATSKKGKIVFKVLNVWLIVVKGSDTSGAISPIRFESKGIYCLILVYVCYGFYFCHERQECGCHVLYKQSCCFWLYTQLWSFYIYFLTNELSKFRNKIYEQSLCLLNVDAYDLH